MVTNLNASAMKLYVVFNFYYASAYLKNMLCLATSSEEPCFIQLDNSLINYNSDAQIFIIANNYYYYNYYYH